MFSILSEQDFNQNVGEVACSIFVPVCWTIAQNVGTWLGNKDKIYINSHSLQCRDSGDQQIQKIFFLDSYTLCLCWTHWFVSQLNYLRLTKPQCSNVFIQVRNICFIDTSHLVLLEILFVLKVKLGTFSPIHSCEFWFNLKYIFVVMQVELLEWNFWHGAESSGRAFQDGQDTGLSLSKYFWPAYKTFL